MDRRVLVNGTVVCASIAVFLAGSSCPAQDDVRSAQNSVSADLASGGVLENAGLFENIGAATRESCDLCDGASCGSGIGCYDCYGGRLTARAGALFMKREAPDGVPLVIDNAGAGPVALAGSDFDFGFEAGVEADLIYDHPNLRAPIQARYFWINHWSDTRRASGLTNARVNTTPMVGSFSTLDFADYQSQLESIELHFRKQLPCDITLMIGVRYVSFDEDLDMLLDGSDQFWWGITNDLYGFQLGAEGVLYDNCCRFRVDGFIKAGIYGNDADVATRVQLVEQSATSQRTGMDHVAFVGELGLIGTYDLSACWSVRAGYQAMWLDGVLVAANQVPVTDNNAMTLAFDYTDVFFHGAMVQLERRW